MSVRSRVILYVLSAVAWVGLGVGTEMAFYDGDISRAEQLLLFLASTIASVLTLSAVLATLVGSREAAYDVGYRTGRSEAKIEAQEGRSRLRVVRSLSSN